MLNHDETRSIVATEPPRPFRFTRSSLETTRSLEGAAAQVRTPEPATRPVSPSSLAPPLSGRLADFGRDASIVLAGIRGAGKSTLAIIACSAMKRRVIDMENIFQQSTGWSSAAFKKVNGSAQCHEKQASILEETLDNNRTGCIIVCSWMEASAQQLLRSFSVTNPVIHVVRNLDAIQQHLKITDRDKMQSLLTISNAIFRSCTRFEFFNLSEPSSASTGSRMPSDRRLPPPHLTLKGAERHFLKFLSLIFPSGSIPFIDSAFLLANILPEQLPFTYALSVSLSDVLNDDFDIEEHTAGVDAVQIVIPTLLDLKTSKAQDAGFFEPASDITRAVAAVRRSSVLPIITHIPLPEVIDTDSLSLYLSLVSHTLRLAPEMITLDLRLDDLALSPILEARARTRVIGDYSFASDCLAWTSPVLVAQYTRAVQLRFDMARFLQPATSIEDNFTVANFRAAIQSKDGEKIPLVAYTTGAMGRNSACFNPTLTVVEPEQPLSSSHTPEPRLSARDATLALSASFIYDPMKLYVFGANVDWSMSPAMHNAALVSCGMPHRYEPHSTDSLIGLGHLIEDPYFGGASVGLPFKVEIISLTHSLSRHAQAIGAVNTLIPVRYLDDNGSVPQGAQFFRNANRAGPVKALYGENTDWIGIRACIRRGLSPANAVRQSTWGLLVGAGGMARAACYAMLQVGVQNIAIYNRTVSRAEKFANHFKQLLEKEDSQFLGAGRETRFHIVRDLNDPWPSDFSLPTIIISCIPTNRIGDMAAPDFRAPEEWLGSRTGGVIIELGYKTLDTPLLAQARSKAAQGWVAMDGLDLLPDQGFAQFELFTGRRAPRRVMRRDLLKAYAEAHGTLEREEMGPRLGSINEPLA